MLRHRCFSLPVFAGAAVLAVACGGPAEPTAPGSASGSQASSAAEPATAKPSPAARPPTEPPTAKATDAPAGPPILVAHNRHRARHCAPPLRWSRELAAAAQRWADDLAARGCAFEHSKTRYGENLAAGTASALDAASVTDMWYREHEHYDFRRGRFSMATGHFTQLAWRDTERLGCGTSTCKGMEIWVCNYDPPGNVEGQFRDQVRPASCGD